MTIRLRIILCFAIVIYFLFLFLFLKKKTFSLKYTLFWILAGLGGIILVLFPELLNFIVQITEIHSVMNGLFVILDFFLILLLLSLTAIVSKQTDRIKNLVQDSALMEERIRKLEYNREQKGKKVE